LLALAGVFGSGRCSALPPRAGRCITNSPTERRPSTAKWWTSSATCPWFGRFAGSAAEHSRLDTTIDREMTARRRSLLYLEKLRLFHAVVTVVLIIALVGMGHRALAERNRDGGDVVLVCTLGLSILHATRDLAVALVDVTQHLARLSEALATLLIPHRLRDHPEATPLERSGATVDFENIDFCYPDGRASVQATSACASNLVSVRAWSGVGLRNPLFFGPAAYVSMTAGGRIHRRPRYCARDQESLPPPSPSFAGASPYFTARSWRTSLWSAGGLRRGRAGAIVAPNCDFIDRLRREAAGSSATGA